MPTGNEKIFKDLNSAKQLLKAQNKSLRADVVKETEDIVNSTKKQTSAAEKSVVRTAP